jgi:hydroxyethylthiazole kinase
MNNFGERAAAAFERLRQERPLLHHITNLVVMNDTANLTLHLGALPVMAHALEEVEEMVRLAGALILNPGTPNPDWIASMLLAGQAAQARNIPIVLDPVGAGATRLRTETNQRLLQELKIAIVRGNAGEIGALAGAGGEVKGVESVGGPEDVASVARQAARAWGAVVAVTGKRDIVSDGKRVLAVDNGHSWLTTLTGTGCMATTAVAAFAAVEKEALIAAAGALAAFGLAAELAFAHAAGPASFKVALFDQLYHLTPEQLAAGARISRL